MTGRPLREKPKETVRVAVSQDVRTSILPLLKNELVDFASFSELVETIMFLSEHIYTIEPDNSFVIKLEKIRHKRVLAQIKDHELMRSRFIHVTLDVQAVGFLDLLVRKYPMLFRNRSDVMELLLANVGSECAATKGVRYYANRLAEVKGMHPTRKG